MSWLIVAVLLMVVGYQKVLLDRQDKLLSGYREYVGKLEAHIKMQQLTTVGKFKEVVYGKRSAN